MNGRLYSLQHDLSLGPFTHYRQGAFSAVEALEACFALLTGQSVPILLSARIGRSNAIPVLFRAAILRIPICTAASARRCSRAVATGDSMHPRHIVDSRAVSVCRNSHGTQRDHASPRSAQSPFCIEMHTRIAAHAKFHQIRCG